MSDEQHELVNFKQLLLSQLYTLHALVNVLERKVLLTKEELTALEKTICSEKVSPIKTWLLV